jgi:anti-sigma B factor antagonist
MSEFKFKGNQLETEKAYVIYISGELDLSAAPQFRSMLEQVVNKNEKALILNLKDLTYIDSTGIGIIISVLKIRDEAKAAFSVHEIPTSIKRLFDLTGISEFLKEGTESGS